ncbi:hypothetical protein CLAFUW4_13622 [Fulvia fulva]|uniref:Uncharacterized protein n=1 Tax=Passalora fulva TaxID=5499 RepID=A0A9Q8PLD9_PASFU|nr:uncharacterized protein CLAFUR5_13474 [Fulvia fulva]KAK4610643.1 hypothetical protein CLAFUR4_13625 [Fulvia fulva]KAK4611295.1 hypothetical protein CLAFUR0_13629 [Fulvia fulva]UJO24557.1 hypothetical protein CLAFUR5_13474 [Fulvia fulva]WPV22305.1 hypothetical protein CLAFUW4_13622 [Fulvia fulva]WPV36733.1 hypothetical protein CLAFUW7_13630 [Fulvia fulva]
MERGRRVEAKSPDNCWYIAQVIHLQLDPKTGDLVKVQVEYLNAYLDSQGEKQHLRKHCKLNEVKLMTGLTSPCMRDCHGIPYYAGTPQVKSDGKMKKKLGERVDQKVKTKADVKAWYEEQLTIEGQTRHYAKEDALLKAPTRTREEEEFLVFRSECHAAHQQAGNFVHSLAKANLDGEAFLQQPELLRQVQL